MSDPDRPEPPLPDPAGLAGLGPSELAAALRPLWEDAGPVARHLAGRSFGSWDDLIDAAAAAIGAMGDAERVELLRAHPRLGDSPEALLARSRASWREQGRGRPLEPGTALRLHQLNSAYEARFGFPFVEWVRGRPLAAIVEVLEQRLARDRTAELAAGCDAMVAIARDRLRRTSHRRM